MENGKFFKTHVMKEIIDCYMLQSALLSGPYGRGAPGVEIISAGYPYPINLLPAETGRGQPPPGTDDVITRGREPCRSTGHRAQGTGLGAESRPACRQAESQEQGARSRNELRYLWLSGREPTMKGREPTNSNDRFKLEWEYYGTRQTWLPAGREHREREERVANGCGAFAALRLCGVIILGASAAAQRNICSNERNIPGTKVQPACSGQAHRNIK